MIQAKTVLEAWGKTSETMESLLTGKFNVPLKYEQVHELYSANFCPS